MYKFKKWILIVAIFISSVGTVQAETRVIMLGTGTPLLNSERAGPAAGTRGFG